MNMHYIDWLIPIAMLVLMIGICLFARTLNKSVADFLAANRMGGRYLLAVGQGMTGLGAISIAANFEKYYQTGFSAYWWAKMVAPIGLILALTGFVVYRYRETRALTMAQFFEMRYSHNFRIFSGILAWTSGILNYGIFPAVSARFLIYFTGLPVEFEFLGHTFPTLALVMLILMSIALLMVSVGGQISIMVTDMLQGQFVNVALLIILAILFCHMSWGDVMEGLRHSPPGESRINPFKQDKVGDFNMWFFVMMGILQVYGTRAWQGSQAYNAAARNPHEAKMANILGEFRGMVTTLVILLIPIFIFAYLHLDEFSSDAVVVTQNLSLIEDTQIQKQMRVPMALGEILPVGVIGLFTAVIIMAAVSTDNTYLHSWGSIFIQDVFIPLRKNKKKLSQKAHMWLLRLSIVGVASFGFIWSLMFPLNEYIYMYFQITGAIYLGGAGAVIIGGLYWKRGTVGGAWAAMITGSTLAVSGIVLRNIIWPKQLPNWKLTYSEWGWLQSLPEKFPLNGMQMSFFAAVLAVLAYVFFSLISKTPPANMDKLLHRGKYSVEPKFEASAKELASVKNNSKTHLLLKRLGINDDFTRGDRIIYFLKIAWVMFFVISFIIGTTINVFYPIPDSAWEKWWGLIVTMTICASLITVVWFLWGGFRDLMDLIRKLGSLDRNLDDDGSVSEEEHVQ
ncbi:sodium:solute symporter family protein [Thalassobacterium maritimum]|nr:hypothetical protein [Coraliomargarita sp. SDUM461003]